jgi:xanthine dehydrogenase molybdenum-binding subunit
MVILDNDGSAELVAGISDLGVGAKEIFAQVAAEKPGMKIEHISVSYGDSKNFPYTINSSYGSRTT